MECRIANSASKALIIFGALLTLTFIHPHKSHGLSCGTLFSFGEFIPPQNPTTETIRNAARFIRAQDHHGLRQTEFPLGLQKRDWESIPLDLKPTFRAVDQIQRSSENFARWVESLERDLITEEGKTDFRLTGELFLSTLKSRVARLGWPEITEAKKFEEFHIHRFLIEVVNRKQPWIETWEGAKTHSHGWFAHLIQWVYIAESLEFYEFGSALKFFDFVTSQKHITFLRAAMDQGEGAMKLHDPGYVWSSLGFAFDLSFIEGASLRNWGFIDPKTNEPFVVESQN